MSPRRMLLYDIPDGHQLIHHYLDELRRELSPVSADMVLEQLKEVADCGWILTECKPQGQGILALDAPMGYGLKCRTLFFETPRGDYMALHAFTVGPGIDAAREFSIAVKRKEDLIG